VPVTQPAAARPSPSPMRGTTSDPFAALDSQSVQERSAAADELAARFPSLDEFSLLHDRGKKFEFGQAPTTPDPQLSQRVTEALADEAFAFPVTKIESAPAANTSPAFPSVAISSTASVKRSQPLEETRQPSVSIQQPTPNRPGMVSTGIQTSPSPSPAPQVPQKFDVSKRPIWRVPEGPDHHRTVSQPRTFEKPLPPALSLRPDYTMPSRPSLSDNRSKSQTSTLTIPKSPMSSRPSLESQRPTAMDIGYTIDRSKSANSNTRPTSMHVESNLDYLRDRERSSGRSFDQYRGPSSGVLLDSDSELEDKNIVSNVDFLKSIEDDGGQKKHRRSSSQSKHTKRTSLSSITSNTKNIVKGRFGDAFRRFENNSNSGNQEKERDLPVTPTEQKFDPRTGKTLTPIAGSEATGDMSDDERAIDETQDLPPEVRRELERRRLSQEEHRVEAATAEYRQKLALQDGKGGKSGPTRASTIQNRVRSLLDDSSKTTTPSRTAEGYGKYTKPPVEMEQPLPTRPQDQSQRQPPVIIARKPVSTPTISQQQSQPPQDPVYAKPRITIPIQQSPHIPQSASAPPISRVAPTSTGTRPSAPPKPKALRTGGTADFPIGPGGISPTKQLQTYRQSPTIRVSGEGPGGEEWDMDSFSKRYPSLTGLEMVETEIEIPVRRGAGGVREL
jgi:AP2-associated kinase